MFLTVIASLIDFSHRPCLGEYNEKCPRIKGIFNSAVKEQYGGGKLKRLIDTRWSRHLAARKSIQENLNDIDEVLELATRNKKLDAMYRATAIEFQEQTTTNEFTFLTHFILDILKLCDMANKNFSSINN